MAPAAAAPRVLWLSWALLLLLAVLLHSASTAAPEKKVPSRSLRIHTQSSPHRSSIRWRLPHSSSLRSPRRYPGYRSAYGESKRKMSYIPLPKEERNNEMKKLASESVYVVSLPSRTSQALSQPAYRAALTKRKVAEEEEEQEEAKDITVRVMSSQSVLVTWSDSISEKQKTAASRQYTVRYREKGESARWDYKQVPNKRVLVDKLIPDTMYEFAVRISQGEKEGRWSASVYQRTPEAAPTSAPENLEVLPIKGKATSVAATWDALPENEGRVKEYILSYAPALKPFGAKSITYPGETTSAIVDDLEPGERYIFKIRAGNRRGQGPQSKAFSVVLPATSIPEVKSSQQTHTEDALEIKTSGNTEPFPPFQISSVLSEDISKHTSRHSSSVSHERNSENPLSDLKNKFLSGSSVPPKTQLSSRRRVELEIDSHSTEGTSDHDSSSRTSIPSKIQDVVRPQSPVKPSHSVLSSGRTALRSRTVVRTGKISTDKERLSPSSSSARTLVSLSASSSPPKEAESETKNTRHDSSNHHSFSEVTVDNLPDDNESNDQLDSVEKTSITSSKTPGDTHLILSSNQRPSASQKVIHPIKLLTPSVSLKSSASVPTSSQKHSHYPSNKLVSSDTSDTPDTHKSRETEEREQKPNSRLSFPQGGSSTAMQRKPLSNFNHHTLRDSRVATSAVSAAATHTLLHSHGSSSAKNKPDGRDDSDDNSENSKKEKEENRQRSSSRGRLSSGQPVSERFNLFKYRSALTANRFANKAGSSQDAMTQPSEAPSSTSSSKVHPQSSSQLTSGSIHKLNANTNSHKELESEDEHPLPSTPHHGYSSSYSRQSSSVDYSRRRSSLTELRNPHIIAGTDKSSPTNVKKESFGEERGNKDTKTFSTSKDSFSSVSGQSPSLSRINHRSSSSASQRLTNGQSTRSRGLTSSTDSFSRTSMEKSTPLQTPTSIYQPDDLATKEDMAPKSIQTPILSKKTLMGSSHALSRKTLRPEPSRYQKAVTDQSQHQPSLNSRSRLTMTSYQNKEKLEDEEGESLGENYHKGVHDQEEQRASPSVPIKDVSSSRRISTSLSQGNTESFLLKHSDSHTSKSGERSSNRRESLTSSRGLSSSPGKPIGSQVITSNEDTSDALPVTSHQSKYIQPGSTFAVAKDHQYSRGTSLSSKASSTKLRQTHSSAPHSQSGSKVSQTDKKYGLIQPTPTKVELYPKTAYSKMHQSLSNNNDNYEDYAQPETEENPTLSSVSRWSSSISRDSKHVKNNVASDKHKSPNPILPHTVRFPDEEEYKQEEEMEEEHPALKISNAASLGRSTSLTSRSSQTPSKSNTLPKINLALPRSSGSSSVPFQLHPTHAVYPTHSSSSPSVSTSQQKQVSRLLNPSQWQHARVPHRQGSGGRPNLTTKLDLNNKITPGGNGKRNGQRIINGPQGVKWIVDLDRGLLLNVEGRYLQDSQGKPLRVKLGGDGRTIVDSKGAPIVSPDGLPLFGHGRFSKPVANAQDKPIISLGGKPLIGLEMVKKTTTPSTTRTTITTATTTTTTTTTPDPTTTEPPTEKPLPTCPPGSYAEYDEEGNLVLGLNGLPECNSEDVFSGHDADVIATTESYVVYDEDYELFETTLPPSTTTIATEALPEIGFPEFSNAGSDPLSEYDAAGKKRFSAPYVTYLNKDPAAPCSLTEALDHFQVESLDEIIPADLKDIAMRPQKVPHNITIVAVEGCHSFVIVDWAKPTRGDLVTGYLVYSASYDDFLRNKWSTKTAGSTHLPIENLKPNTRYYFKVQAKNLYGYGPISSSVSFVTESDNPLLIVRPPGGEPIWIPFTFKYDPTYSECSGKQYVKRTWYRKFVGVVLCNSLRYKIYLSDDLRDTFYSIGDSWGRGEDHCQFVDSHLDGRTGPQSYVEALPTIQGYYRQYRQEPVSFGRIGYMTPYYYVGWYECGVPIPGKW
ncbi:fibronectin type III domain-containing protein 1 [Heteronotia binoei]|uniref:fibronectin type III domain-containing protein 1 n=1 Tax=Heteronotia binoei TaxID=13085 RepID=UPI00292D7137|nr:fibronectin type III domain-containing protein 1 [Heteronotia binoei]